MRRSLAKHPKLDRGNHANNLGTLGTGNHFIEVCLDESEAVWLMLHSGSRGVGNRIGTLRAFERSQLDTIVRHVRHQLAETDAALGRVEAGTYGVCAVCGRGIPAERLEARPSATRCVVCAAR